MAVLDGCESQYRTPVPEEKTCPVCGKTVEVFTSRGRICEDSVCECGYEFKAELPDPVAVERDEEKTE